LQLKEKIKTLLKGKNNKITNHCNQIALHRHFFEINKKKFVQLGTPSRKKGQKKSKWNQGEIMIKYTFRDPC
jgi:hypothetical protein